MRLTLPAQGRLCHWQKRDSGGVGMSELQDVGSAVSAPVETKSERSWVVLKQTVLVAALILLPLFYTLVPPLEDYPNHLARMQALASIPGNEALSQFYEVAWAPVPNLIMDLIVPPLARVV